ncbi:hypothetical protein B0H13DRAFT_1881117 [Mycena leptocephala]|nr:hypothetical protein B0H13DRAFT_1881117 [Mycena leptocephala]
MTGSDGRATFLRQPAELNSLPGGEIGLSGGEIGPTVNDWFSRQGHLSEAGDTIGLSDDKIGSSADDEIGSIRRPAELNGLQGGEIGLSLSDRLIDERLAGPFSEAASLSNGILSVASNCFTDIDLSSSDG